MVRRDPNRVAYRDIAADIRGRILAGEFLPGNKLGTEKQLAWQYDVGVWTIGNAIDVLRREGFVEPFQRGLGIIVRNRPPVREVVHRLGSLVSARPATVEDAERAADPSIEAGVWLLIVESGDDTFVYRADSVRVRFFQP
jgi:GntR family transcriptional regulator